MPFDELLFHEQVAYIAFHASTIWIFSWTCFSIYIGIEQFRRPQVFDTDWGTLWAIFFLALVAIWGLAFGGMILFTILRDTWQLAAPAALLGLAIAIYTARSIKKDAALKHEDLTPRRMFPRKNNQ